jgi:glycosyltransferase involved in cell wall biosynthesis
MPDEEVVLPSFCWNFTYGEMLNFSLLTLKIHRNSDAILISSASPNIFGVIKIDRLLKNKKVFIYVNMPPLINRRGLWRFYYAPYIYWQRRLCRYSNNLHILANSSFVAKIIRETFGVNSDIIYPPVDIKRFYISEKQEFVVSLGRFNPFKRFEVLINSFAKIGRGKCIIIGSVINSAFKESVMYLRKLRKMVDELGMRDEIKILVNCPFEKVREILSKSKLYVNCTMFEPFGISVVEGMASGCVPIVHRSGGPYIDIIDHDRYGFSFSESNDLAQKLTVLLNENELYNKYSRRAIDRSKIFSNEIFQRNILSIIESNM